MKNQRGNSSLALVVFVVLLVGGPGWAKNPKNEVYVFGDSLSDDGNLFLLTGGNFPPPPYAQNNSNGPTWPFYFEEQLGVPVHNFAVGGAFTGVVRVPIGNESFLEFSNTYSLSPSPFLGLPGLQEEVADFLIAHPEGANPDALYVIWAGANDLFVALANQGLAENVLNAIVPNVLGAM